MTKIHSIKTSLLTLGLISAAFAQKVEITPTAEFVHVSGRRLQPVATLANEHDKSTFAPGIAIDYAASENWFVGGSYRFIDSINESGTTLPGNNNGGPVIQVVSQYSLSEDIHQFSFRGGWSGALPGGVRLKIGPSVDLDYSRVKINWDYGFGHYSDNSWDLKLGGFASLDYKVSERWNLGVSARFNPTVGRKLYSLGAQVSTRF